MKLKSDKYSEVEVIYPKRKPNLKERTYLFSYRVNGKLSTCVEVSEAVYKTFIDGLNVREIYKDSDWILCCVRDDSVHTRAYSVAKSHFEEEDMELLFPSISIVYEKINEVSSNLVDGISIVNGSDASRI